MQQIVVGRTRALPRLGVMAVIIAGLVALRLAAPADLAMSDRLRDFVTLSISVVIESLPFVFLGIGLSVIIQLWLPQRILLAMLPRQPFARRAVLSVLGVLAPVCECGNVPLARGLMARGIAVPEAVTFLLAAPILNPVTIVTTYQAFGFEDGILFWRVVGAFVIANGIGWLFSRHPDPQRLLAPAFVDACSSTAPPSAGRGRRALEMFAAETSAMLPALFVGSAVAGLIQVGLPRSVLLGLGQSPVISVLAMMGLGFTIAICSNVDAFFALAFRANFLPGSIVAFLVLGAMIDVKMLALLRTTFTRTTLALLMALVAIGVLVLGLAVNLGA